jgi:hypothetical protein
VGKRAASVSSAAASMRCQSSMEHAGLGYPASFLPDKWHLSNCCCCSCGVSQQLGCTATRELQSPLLVHVHGRIHEAHRHIILLRVDSA